MYYILDLQVFELSLLDFFLQIHKELFVIDQGITKVRVYLWLEGQDVDNYDVIAGDSIKINFGFTKDRYGIENT